MTINDICILAEKQEKLVLVYFIVIPLITFVCRLFHSRGNGGKTGLRYLYSFLLYAVGIPGLFASLIAGYSIFIRNADLLNSNLAVQFLPIVSMVVTFVFISQNADFEDLPGSERFFGLMIILGGAFAITLGIQKTRIIIFFGGSIQYLFFAVAGIFLLIQWGSKMLFKRDDGSVKGKLSSINSRRKDKEIEKEIQKLKENL